MTYNRLSEKWGRTWFFFLLVMIASNILLGQRGALLIKNGLVDNGLGQGAVPLDILIDEDRIAWMGDSREAALEATAVIDADGRVVAPGFIDIHAHGDPVQNPSFVNFLAMGVTSIALGMDGNSTAVSDMDRWFADVRRSQPGVNILPFVGHGTLRTESGIGIDRNATSSQLDALTNLCSLALSKGCWGVSMGLEYQPGMYADSSELTAIAVTAGKYNAVITSHIRNEDDDQLDNSINEMVSLAKWCKINISHLKSVFGRGTSRAVQILDWLDGSNAHTVTADVYPYTASYTGIGIVFPEWAKRPKEYARIKKSRGEELALYLKARVMSRNGPEATLFGNGPYKGKTLKEVAQEYGLPFELVLRDVIGPYGTSAAFFVMDEVLQQRLLMHPSIAVGSDGSPTMFHPRGYGSFAKIIEEYVVQKGAFTLTEAIRKMTSLPATILGLEDRGTLHVGMKADLILFHPKDVRAKASFDTPHQLAEGIDLVILNGEIAFKKGAAGTRNGRLLLKK